MQIQNMIKVLTDDNWNITTHSFRRSFATMHARNKVSIYDIKWLMGHKSIKTTAMYIKHDPKRILKIKSTLDYV